MYLVLGNLVCLVGTAAFSWLQGGFPDQPVFAFALRLALAVGAVCVLIVMFGSHHQVWFKARSIAESGKTLAWRYMMGASPLERTLAEPDAQRRLLDLLRQVEEEHSDLATALIDLRGNPQITAEMKRVRGLSTRERGELYLRDRFEDQRRWYAAKAAGNKCRARNLLAGVLLFEGLALVASFVLMNNGNMSYFIGLLIALATAAIAWLEVKQHRELAQTYALTCRDLAHIGERRGAIAADDDLARFVEQVESVISREHTMWIARHGACPRQAV